MTTKLMKWGNSEAVRIPKELLKAHSLRTGTLLEFKSTKEGILIKSKKKTKIPYFDIRELCKNMTPYNKRDIIDWGPPQGKEIW